MLVHEVSSLALTEFTLPETVGRSAGLHMSDIYNDFYALKEPDRFDKSKPMDPLRVMAGNAIERVFERALANELGPLLGGERPGELVTACGLPYSPDLIMFEGRMQEIIRLGEIKCTWMSCRECPISPAQAKRWDLQSNWDGKDPHVTFPPKFDKYFTQIKVYAYHLGTVHARLFVFFVVGDYRPPRPVILYWDFTFSKQEVGEEWLKMQSHARVRGMRW